MLQKAYIFINIFNKMIGKEVNNPYINLSYKIII